MLDLSRDSKIWEYLALIVLLVTLTYMGPVNIWDKQIDHGYPYGFYAQDAFIFTGHMYYLEDSGNWRHLPTYLTRGQYTDVIQTLPPLLELLSTLLSQVTGFGFYTTIYIIVMLLVLLAVLCFYFIIRSFNAKVALLSLPLNVLLFSNVFITAFAWGNWPFFAGSAMFVLFFWCLARIKERWIPALGSLAMAAVVLGHTSEYIFMVPLLGFLFLVDIISRTFKWEEWKRIAGMALCSVLISIHYLIIFIKTFLHDYQPQYLTPQTLGLSQFVSVTTLGTILPIVIALGILVGLLMIKKHRTLQISLVMFLIGFTNYIGTGKRGLETRYMWPIYLSVFLGLLIYLVLKTILKKKLSTIICAFLSIALTLFLATQYYVPLDGPGLLSKEGWQGIEWIAQQTPKDATVLYMFGDAYGQAGMLFNTQRVSDVIQTEDYIAMAQSGKLRRVIETQHVFEHANALAYRKGLFSFGFHGIEDNVTVWGPSDLCSFDYLVLDKVSRIIPGAGQYNIAIAQYLVNNRSFTPAYQNDGVVILMNPKPGGECIS